MLEILSNEINFGNFIVENYLLVCMIYVAEYAFKKMWMITPSKLNVNELIYFNGKNNVDKTVVHSAQT